MNTQKYVQAIVDATGISGETLGAVRMGIQLAVNDEAVSRTQLLNGVAYMEALLSEKASQAERLQGLEDRLLAWLDEHSKDLPIVLAEDYDQHLADVIIEVLNQQHVTIRTQHEALAAQKEAMSRMRQQEPTVTINVQPGDQTDYGALAKRVVAHMNGSVSAASTANPNGSTVTITDPTVPADWPHGEALYVELHRLAQNGVGPSKSRWDDERAAGMPKADEVIAKTSLRWYHVLKAAGLMSPTKQPWRIPATEAAPDGDATFRA